jgi:hypothetical protein
LANELFEVGLVKFFFSFVDVDRAACLSIETPLANFENQGLR